MKETKQCVNCSNGFDPKEVKRVYGESSAVYMFGFCSAKCYTEKRTKGDSDAMVNAVDNKNKRDWSTNSDEKPEGLQFELAVYSKKDNQIYKLSCLDMRGRRFDCSAKTKTIYVRFEDGILFNFTTDLETYYDSTKIKDSIEQVRKTLNQF